MKRAVVMIIALMGLAGLGFAQQSGIGAGLESEWDMGLSLSGKYWLNKNTAICATLAGGGISADYLLHKTDRFAEKKRKGAVHYGAGIQLSSGTNDDGEDTLDIGVRIPLGMDHYWKSQPMDFYWSYVPSIGTGGFRLFNFEWGIRYYF